MSRRSKVVLTLALGVIGVVGLGAVTALAAHSAASQFELMLDGKHLEVPTSPDFPFGIKHQGTFTSGAPFCGSGTFADLQVVDGGGFPAQAKRRFTCDDGSGTADVSIAQSLPEHDPPLRTSWRFIEGTGTYAGLRGKGSLRGELLSGTVGFPLSQTWRGMFQGFVDDDAVAPTIAFSSAKVTKLRRPADAYSLRLALAIRDDVEDNPVGYAVVVRGGGLELARKVGSTASGAVSMALRVRSPNTRVRAIRVQVTATDPVGNERSFARSLQLPR